MPASLPPTPFASLPTATRQVATPGNGFVTFDEGLHQFFSSDGATQGSIATSYRYYPADPSSAQYAPNILGGSPYNFIDPIYSSSAILSGGRPGYANKLLHTTGQQTGNDFSLITGGYDLIATDLWPGQLGGAHNRINTNVLRLGVGTISTSGNIVTGVGTSFTSSATGFNPGDSIFAGGIITSIASIQSDTQLTTSNNPALPSLSGQPYYLTSGAMNALSTTAGTFTSSDTAITGSGTTFLTTYRVGSAFPNTLTNEIRFVTAITSNTALTISAAFAANVTTPQAPGQTAWFMPRLSYTSNALTDHSSVLTGTFAQLYNAHYAVIAGGTQNIIGWDGANDVVSDRSVIIGGDQNIVCNPNSAIVGGHFCTILSTNCFASGNGNFIGNSSAYSNVFGNANTVSSSACFVAGDTIVIGTGADWTAAFGRNHNLAARYCLVSGNQHSVIPGAQGSLTTGFGARANWYGSRVFSSGNFLTIGDNQKVEGIARAQTTDATPTALTTTNSASTSGYLYAYGTNTATYTVAYWQIEVVAMRKTTSDLAIWDFKFATFITTAGTLAIIDAASFVNLSPTISNGAGSAYRFSLSVNTITLSADLIPIFTGTVGHQVSITSNLKKLEVTYA